MFLHPTLPSPRKRPAPFPCRRGLHLTLVLAVGIPGVLLFAVGMPLLSAWWLGRNRHRLDQPDFEALYGTLYEEYEVGAGAAVRAG